jgi:subfamily B ATP-binding cassette protein HlyB/CyaB
MQENLEPTTSAADNGLIALVMMLRFHGLGIDPERIRHQFGHRTIGVAEMLRCAKDLGLRARVVRSNWTRLPKIPMPALAILNNGKFLLLGKIEAERVIVLEPGRSQPTMMAREELAVVWDGPLLLMTKRASLSDLARRFDITWFIAAIYKYRRLLSEVLVASFFLQIFALISPLFFQVVVDKVLVHRSLNTLDVLAIGLIAVALFETILSILRTYLLSHTTNRIDVELGARLFRHLLALPIGYFQTRRVGDSVARVRELENIRNFLTSSSLTIAIDLFFTIIFIAVLFIYSPLLTWIVIAAFPVYIAISAIATPLFQHRLDEKFRRGAENQSFLVESVTAIETLKAMAVEPQMQRRWEEQLAAYVTASFRVLSLGNFASQSVQFISKLVSALILYFGARQVINGDLTVGELVAFNLLASRVNAPILRLAQVWQDFQQTRLSIARLGDILNTAPEPAYAAGRMSLATIRGDVRFEHVSFRYRIDGPETLSDINLDCPAGQVVGVVGPSGSGKSTLAKLVQRLYVPEKGRVLIDGIDVAQVDPSWLRRQIGVVLQDSVLLNSSIRDNIALVDPATPAEKVIEAAVLAGAHDFILELPEGYDTIVGERGSTLSGGQRQRIAIARALVTDPRILIFDEATSALDYESERIVQKNMARIAKARTVIIIAHRISALRMADRIITIENGRLIEDGTHQELVKTGGRYSKLYRLQAGFHEDL